LTDRGREVAAVVSPGVSLFELGTVCEIFGADPNLGVPWYRFGLYSAAPPPVPTSQPGVLLHDVKPLSSLRSRPGDLVLVTPPSKSSEETRAGLRRVHARGARLASICTGAFVLAEAGLLDGRPATTHWENAPDLAERYPEVDVDPRVLYIDDGDVLTSAGSAACIDLCLHIVRTDYGAEISNEIARQLVVPPHREGGQAQFVTTAVRRPAPGDTLGATLEWIQANLPEPITIDDMAARSAMSPRTFARRFYDVTGTTPLQWLLSQRLRLAQRLLEKTDLAIDRVAEDCGLGSPANLRAHFQHALGTTPTAYRRTFRAQHSAQRAARARAG
jgi:transcriptional regulator GlxA family with amidase domain